MNVAPQVEHELLGAVRTGGPEPPLEQGRRVEIQFAQRAHPPAVAVVTGVAAEGLGWLKRWVGPGHGLAPEDAAVYRQPGRVRPVVPLRSDAR